MSDDPISPTQRRLDPEIVARLVAASFGSGDRSGFAPPASHDRPRRPPRMVGCGPMSGGGFAAVWWVDLDDGRRVVLKVAPPPEAGLLRYERRLIAAEARYFRLVAARVPGVPVPPVLHHGEDPRVLDGDWLFTGRLPGRPLPDLAADGPADGRAADGRARDTAPVRAAFGAALAALHAVTGDRFGYDDGRTGAPTWRGAFTAIVDDRLADAVDWKVELPTTAARIRELIGRHAHLLDLVDRPALLHWDGWDGNVLAAPGPDGALRMTGLVDGERFLFGDPLMDLVSPALFRRIEDEPDHPFLLGYAGAARPPLVLDEGTRRRLTLYRLHLYLLMTIEMPSRGMTPETTPDRRARLAALLDEQLTELGRR